jgi:hypothetical protein
MLILLEVGSIELGGHEVIFHGHFQGSNAVQYCRTNPPRQGDSGHYRYISGPVQLLNRDQWATYVAATVQ